MIMIRSDRVRELISSAGITQAELARRVNVTQGAIAKIAKNNPAGSSVLHLVARELGTTPAYLTGETDDPQSDSPSPILLDADERELFSHFIHLPVADRKALLQIVRTMSVGAKRMADSANSPTEGGNESDEGASA